MASSFFRKLASVAKAKLQVGKPLPLWVRPAIESLDQRILPSVNAYLNQGSILKIIADTHQQTSQVEIIQAPGQILVEIGGQLVNSFDPSQVQQIDFKYREHHHQHTKFDLNIPVNQQQMTLSGIAVGEADLNLGAGSLTATVNATLADGTALSLTGPVDNQGNYDLTGTADISVDGFTLPSAAFELTPANMAVCTTITLGGTPVSLCGTVDGQGNYDLTGAANVTVGGFALNANFELTNTSLTAAAALTLGPSTVNLSGSVDGQGNYDLTGTANVTVAGFPLNASFELTNTSLTAAATVTLGSDTVALAGTVDHAGNYDLTGTGHVTIGGFGSDANFALTNTNLAVAATVNIPNFGNLIFSGLVDNTGHYNLTASAPVVLAGFASVGNANLILANSGLTVSAAMNLQVATVNLSGPMQTNGQFSLTGSASVSLGGYSAVPGAFTLNNSGASVAASLNIIVATVAFSGAIHTDGTYALTGSASVTLGGFGPVTGAFTLNNSGVSVAATVNVVLATVNFSGPISKTGTYALTGSANVGLAGFPVANANFTLSNSGCTLSANVNVFVAMVTFSGSVAPNGNFQLTGTASAVFAGFSGSGTFTLNNSGLSFAGNVNVVVATVAFTGSIDNHGNFRLTGSASVGLAGFAPAPASFVLTNSGCTLSANVNVVVATVAFSGTVDNHGNFRLTGSANVVFAGFPAATTAFNLSNNGCTLSANINIGVATVAFSGPLDTHGAFRLTATANVTLAGFSAAGAAFVLTNSGCTLSANINIGVATVAFAGTVDNHGNFQLTANAHIALAGFGANVALTLKNTGLTAAGTLDLAVMGFRMAFSGAMAPNGSFSFTGGTNINFGPITSTLTLTLTNSGFTAHVHAVDDVSTTVNYGPWSARVSYRGSFDVSFAIATNGTYSASGTFTMTAYQGVTGSSTIHYSITNHQFLVKNSEIGFSLWGVGFNPYPDAAVNY